MNELPDDERRRLLAALLAGSLAGTAGSAMASDDTGDGGDSNALLWALAWQQTAAEFAALCHQAYNLARFRLDEQLTERPAGARPLAVIADIDNTVLHANSYWGYLVNNDRQFFDDAIWDDWLPENLMTPVPGALDFLRYCEERGVEVFYVTNRDQGDKTYDYALRQLQELSFPFADNNHLYVFRETSDKTPARQSIATRFEIALMLGDNLNDFRRDYYVKDVDERMQLMERDRDDWGSRFILLPNATDGHWVRAIFGESEPAPTAENLARLRAAASRVSWQGKR